MVVRFSSRLAIRSPRRPEGGFILALFSLLLIVVILYGAVVLSTARNNKERTRLHALTMSALRAAMNTGPNPVDFFEAACNTVAATMFQGSSAIGCDPKSDFPLPSVPTDPRIAQYSDVVSQDGDITCESVRFIHTPAKAAQSATQPGTPPKFCVEMNCADSALKFLNTSVEALGASSCISGANAVGYLAIDYSNSLHNIFPDWPEGGSEPSFGIPPSFATLGNDNYISATNTPSTMKYFTDPPGAGCSGCLGLSDPADVLRQVIDYQPIGIRESLDPLTGELIAPLDLPFATKEIDKRKNSLPAELALNGNISGFLTDPKVDNPDQLSDEVLSSLPEIVNLSASGNGADGLPDPIQYIGAEPFVYGLNSVTRQWAAPEAEEFFDAGLNQLETSYRVRSLTRGGHLTQNNLINRCFGVFLHVYKQAAQQALYIMGNYGFRMGVLGFNNWLLPMLPLYPQSFFETGDAGSNPFFGKKVTELPLGGPPINSQPPEPDGSKKDYIKSQFGDNADTVPMTRDASIDLIQGTSLCARFLDHDVNPDPAIEYKPYGALPNPYDSTMPLVPPSFCPQTEVHYDFPLIFGADGKCYRDVDQASYHTSGNCVPCQLACGFCCDIANPKVKNITTLCADPGLFQGSPNSACSAPYTGADLTFSSGGVQFVSGLYGITPTDYLQTGSTNSITANDVVFPYRWCKASPPNLAVGIQAIPSGPFSKIGYERNKVGTVPTTGNALSDPEFPYKTTALNTFTPGALLVAKRALEDPQLSSPDDKKIIVVVTDGFANLSIWRAVDFGPPNTQGYMQTEWFPPNPSESEVARYPGIPGATNELAALHETLHILHSFVSGPGVKPGTRKVIFLFIASAAVGVEKEAMLAGLKSPNAKPTGDTSVTNYNAYNFCKSDFLVNVLGGVSAPGEQVVSAQTCNPNAPGYEAGFSVIDITKMPGENYDDFRTRAYQEISLRLQQEINSFTYSK